MTQPLFHQALFSFKSRQVQLLILILLYLVFAPILPSYVSYFLFSVSLTMKDILIWLLPITVCLFIAHSISLFRHKAFLFIVTLVIFETLSNFASVWYAFLCGHLSVNMLPTPSICVIQQDFFPLWKIPFNKPQWWTADKGALIGLILGMLAAFQQKKPLLDFIQRGKKIMEMILTKIFSRLIPIFILGFIARIYETHLFEHLMATYSVLIAWLSIFIFFYIALLFFIGNQGSFSKSFKAFKNLLPAGGMAFSSGCSLSTMPWTIVGTSKNLQDKELAKAVIPATTNIQQIGDCIINSFLCFLIYTHFFGQTPNGWMWLHFTFFFVLARFATAAVLGGAIFIMLPVYENYLFFNAEMIALILALNVILDPLVTASNVIANGALCAIYEKVWNQSIQFSNYLFKNIKKI